MAKHTVPQKSDSSAPPFNFPSENAPVYSIAPGASDGDLSDLLFIRLAHLDSMLRTVHGDGGECFRGYNDQIQDEYLGACSMLATECRELLEQLSARRVV